MIVYKTEKVPATNNGYAIVKNNRIKKKETRLFCKDIELLTKHVNKKQNISDMQGYVLELNVYWYNPKFYKKKETLSKVAGDIDGPLKFIQDSVAKGLNVDDSIVKKVSLVQLPAAKDELLHTLVIDYFFINQKDFLRPERDAMI